MLRAKSRIGGAFGLVVAGLLAGVTSVASAGEFDAILSRINLPPGFEISVFATTPTPRSLVVAAAINTVFVASYRGTIHSLRDTNADGVADEVLRRANGLNAPNGIAYLDDKLFVAMNDRVAFWPVPDESGTEGPIAPLIDIKTDLPRKRAHGLRYAAIGPDNKLYVAIGSPCNICQPTGIEGTIIRMNPDGSEVEVVARGVRNSVGFDWHPETGVLFFTDNGADGMGDDIPADELNMVTSVGQHFGFPFLGGAAVKLPGFETAQAPADAVAPVIEFQAHTAGLGIHFYRGDMFPSEYKNDAFVAQHGSWNRAEAVGYRIMRIRFDDAGNAVGKEVFADGWLDGQAAVGRPVGISELPDGSLLVSDDFANVIYRVSYSN